MSSKKKQPQDINSIETTLGLDKTTLSKTKKKRWFLRLFLLLLLTIVLIILALPLINGKKPELSYKTEALFRGDLSLSVSATGTVEPITSVDISSELSGKVMKVNVDYNEYVKVGQVLAELNTDVLKNEISHAQAILLSKKAKVAEVLATLNETKQVYQRQQKLLQKKLFARNSVESSKANYQRSVAALQHSKAEVEVAEADLKHKKIMLSKSYIRSPINGIVLERNVDPGQIVASSLQAPVLFVLAKDIKKMQLEVSIDEADIGKVLKGQVGTFRVDAYTEKIFPAHISKLYFSPEIIEGVVTYKAVLSINNDELLLRPGMTATVDIVVKEEKNALLMNNMALRFSPPVEEEKPSIMQMFKQILSGPSPERIVKSTNSLKNDEHTIWVLKNNKATPVTVKTGLTDGINTQVFSEDLKVGDLIIVDIIT